MNKRNNVKKYLVISAIMLLLVAFSGTTVLATATGLTGDSIKNSADAFINAGKNNAPINASAIGGVLKPLANILLAIGTVVLVISAVVMAIKYMTASPDQQGKLKTQLIGLVISGVVLYGAYGIWSILYSILNATF